MTKNPSKVKYKGITYDIDTDTNTILQVDDWLLNHDLDSIDQGIMIVTLIFGVDAPVEQPLIDLATELMLIDKNNNEVNSKRDMCFLQDYPIYRSDIIREYGIDIAEDPIEFEKLIMLISNLSSESKLNQVSGFRTTYTSKIKDMEQKKYYKEMQKFYKLKDLNLTEEENREIKEDKEKLNNLAQQFM